MKTHRINPVILSLVLITTVVIVMGAAVTKKDIYYNIVQGQAPKPYKSPFQAFLHVSDIPGKCADPLHQNWIEVLSYNVGVESLEGRVQIHDLIIEKEIDNASPTLVEACCKGSNIPNVTLEICRVTGDKEGYMEYNLTNAKVASVLPNGSVTSSGQLPMEAVTFTYQRIAWTHTDANVTTSFACDANGNPLE